MCGNSGPLWEVPAKHKKTASLSLRLLFLPQTTLKPWNYHWLSSGSLLVPVRVDRLTFTFPKPHTSLIDNSDLQSLRLAIPGLSHQGSDTAEMSLAPGSQTFNSRKIFWFIWKRHSSTSKGSRRSWFLLKAGLTPTYILPCQRRFITEATPIASCRLPIKTSFMRLLDKGVTPPANWGVTNMFSFVITPEASDCLLGLRSRTSYLRGPEATALQSDGQWLSTVRWWE